MNTPLILDVTDTSFAADVLEASHRVPVLVDFWAAWCGPCRTLGPLLERLAESYGGRFILAKVDTEANPGLAREFGIRSIPDVRAFRDGAPVDGFTGVLPERQLRAFIERIAPAPAEVARLHAATLRAAGDRDGALAALRQAVALDAGHTPARIDLGAALIQQGDLAEAEAQLADVPPHIDWDARVAALRQAIAFQRSGGDEAALTARVAARPDDLEARLALAAAHAARQAWRPAFEELLEIIRRDKAWRNGEARRQMLALFDLAADDRALVSAYRRQLASALN